MIKEIDFNGYKITVSYDRDLDYPKGIIWIDSWDFDDDIPYSTELIKERIEEEFRPAYVYFV